MRDNESDSDRYQRVHYVPELGDVPVCGHKGPGSVAEYPPVVTCEDCLAALHNNQAGSQ